MNEDIMLLKLTIGRVGVSRRVDGEDLEQVTGKELSPAFFKATKKLWSCPEFDAINTVCNKARTFVAGKAVPAPFIGKGFHMISLERWTGIDEGLQEIVAELEQAVDAFLAVYDDRIADSQAELIKQGIPFSADEYPTPGDVRKGFDIRWQPMEMGVPRALERIDAAAFEEAKQRAEKQWDDALANVELLLAAELKSLLDHMVERLTDEEDGKKKIFRDSLVTNLTGFLDELPFRNVCKSDQLDAICTDIKNVLGEEDANALRASPGMRKMVRDKMDIISATIDAAIINKPKRKLVIMNGGKPTEGEQQGLPLAENG